MICHVFDVGWGVVYDGKNVNVTGGARHDRRGTVRVGMVSCGDQGSWSMLIVTSATSWRGVVKR